MELHNGHCYTEQDCATESHIDLLLIWVLLDNWPVFDQKDTCKRSVSFGAISINNRNNASIVAGNNTEMTSSCSVKERKTLFFFSQ